MINNPVNLNTNLNKVTAPQNEAYHASDRAKEVASEKSAVQQFDTLSLGNESQSDFGTYKVDRKKLNDLKMDLKNNISSFQEMVRSMVEKQGLKYNDVLKALKNGEEPVITIDAKTKAKATEAISENGYWGVNKTSERMLEFAKTLSGGDPSKIETLREAFKQGFEKAKEAFGGELPDISQKTYDKVMEGFDAWAAEGSNASTDS